MSIVCQLYTLCIYFLDANLTLIFYHSCPLKVEMLEKIINAMMPMVDVGMRAAEFAERNASTGWGPWKKTDTNKIYAL